MFIQAEKVGETDHMRHMKAQQLLIVYGFYVKNKKNMAQHIFSKPVATIFVA